MYSLRFQMFCYCKFPLVNYCSWSQCFFPEYSQYMFKSFSLTAPDSQLFRLENSRYSNVFSWKILICHRGFLLKIFDTQIFFPENFRNITVFFNQDILLWSSISLSINLPKITGYGNLRKFKPCNLRYNFIQGSFEGEAYFAPCLMSVCALCHICHTQVTPLHFARNLSWVSLAHTIWSRVNIKKKMIINKYIHIIL